MCSFGVILFRPLKVEFSSYKTVPVSPSSAPWDTGSSRSIVLRLLCVNCLQHCRSQGQGIRCFILVNLYLNGNSTHTSVTTTLLVTVSYRVPFTVSERSSSFTVLFFLTAYTCSPPKSVFRQLDPFCPQLWKMCWKMSGRLGFPWVGPQSITEGEYGKPTLLPGAIRECEV